ncbi:MAG: hypothetical protein QM705_12140 [Ancrocorticia sp.]
MMRLIQLVGPIILTAIIISFAGWTSVRARNHPNRAKKNPNRTRLPRFIVFIGALIALLGLPTLATGLFMPESEIGPAVAGACMILGGAFFLYLYANWFVDVGPDRVVFRGFGRRVKTIWYSQIVKYRIEDANGRRSLMVKSSDGTVLHLNVTMFDAGPLLQYIAWLEEQARAQAAREQEQRGAWGQQPLRPVQESQGAGEPVKPSQKPVFIEGEVGSSSPNDGRDGEWTRGTETGQSGRWATGYGSDHGSENSQSGMGTWPSPPSDPHEGPFYPR